MIEKFNLSEDIDQYEAVNKINEIIDQINFLATLLETKNEY